MPKIPTPAAGEAVPATVPHFEPWQHEDGEWKPPTNKEWAELANPYAVTLRVAWIMVHKTEADLAEGLDEMGEDGGRELMRCFLDTIAFFKGALQLLEAAEARILVAGGALDEETEQ